MIRPFLLVSATLLALGACATQETGPFPHLLDAGAGGETPAPQAGTSAVAGSSVGGSSGSTAGAPGQSGGGATSAAGSAGAGDACPDDPLKIAPGACGCGKPETDSDGDLTPDCTDECPMMKAKTKAGCGCDATSADETACQALIAGLAHRYTFKGTGSKLTDSKGTADGTAVGVTLADNGNLELGTGDQYGDLPNGLISKQTNATIEAWVTWEGGAVWQRIVDLGDDTSMVENNRSTGRSYVFLAPRGNGNFVRGVFRKAGSPEVIIDAMPSLTAGDPSQVALVLDDDNDTMTLYVNGAAAGNMPLTDHLSDINDINNWLGRSQFATDPNFVGSMQEFRVYNVALSAAQLALSYSKGADATIFDK